MMRTMQACECTKLYKLVDVTDRNHTGEVKKSPRSRERTRYTIGMTRNPIDNT